MRHGFAPDTGHFRIMVRKWGTNPGKTQDDGDIQTAITALPAQLPGKPQLVISGDLTGNHRYTFLNGISYKILNFRRE